MLRSIIIFFNLQFCSIRKEDLPNHTNENVHLFDEEKVNKLLLNLEHRTIQKLKYSDCKLILKYCMNIIVRYRINRMIVHTWSWYK